MIGKALRSKLGIISLCAASLMALGALQACSADSQAPDTQEGDKISVVASFYPMADFAQKIGGDHVSVTTLVPGGVEPHDWEPTPQDIARLEKAQVFVYNGAGMEHWAEDALESISNKDLVVCEASHGIEASEAGFLKGHHHHHDGDDHEGDDHDHDASEHKHEGEDHDDEAHEHEGEDHDHEADEEGLDPHVWLDPQLAKLELSAICDALIKADPAHEADYRANCNTYMKKCDELHTSFSSELASFAGGDIVVSHQAFGYLCRAYGLQQTPIEGVNADAEPSAAQMKKIADFCKEHQVKVIFAEELVSPKLAETIAQASGASVEVLNPIEGITEEQVKAGADYFSLMEENLKQLKKAFA